MKTQLLLITSIEPLDLSDTCIDSFCPSLLHTSTLAVVVYNGSDKTVTSDFLKNNVAKIGYEDSRRIADKFRELADCPEELLFGKPEYGRSYGGAGNLLLALGYSLGASVLGKVYDDCSELKSRRIPWLRAAMQHTKLDKICFGPYYGRPSGLLYQLPEDIALGLAKFVYSRRTKSALRVLGHGRGGQSIKNGNLVIPRNVVRVASYPVLYDRTTHTHARGEVYYWASELKEKGFTFIYEPSLQIRHLSSGRASLDSWLRSLVLAFDLSLVYRNHLKGGRQLQLSERYAAISQFKSWLLKAKWPESVNAQELAILLENSAMGFTEAFYANLKKRQTAWTRLMNYNLSAHIQRILPALHEKMFTISVQKRYGRLR